MPCIIGRNPLNGTNRSMEKLDFAVDNEGGFLRIFKSTAEQPEEAQFVYHVHGTLFRYVHFLALTYIPGTFL